MIKRHVCHFVLSQFRACYNFWMLFIIFTVILLVIITSSLSQRFASHQYQCGKAKHNDETSSKWKMGNFLHDLNFINLIISLECQLSQTPDFYQPFCVCVCLMLYQHKTNLKPVLGCFWVGPINQNQPTNKCHRQLDQDTNSDQKYKFWL